MAPTRPDERRTRFDACARTVWEPLHRYVRRRVPPSDVDDVVSETLTACWRRLDDIPPGAEVPWCLGAARRVLANHRRGTGRRTALSVRLGAEPEPATGGAEPDPALDAALALLPEDDREVLHLWAWERLEPREIAVVLAITPNTAAARLSRARRRLRNLLAGRGHDPARGGHEQGGAPMEQPS